MPVQERKEIMICAYYRKASGGAITRYFNMSNSTVLFWGRRQIPSQSGMFREQWNYSLAHLILKSLVHQIRGSLFWIMQTLKDKLLSNLDSPLLHKLPECSFAIMLYDLPTATQATNVMAGEPTTHLDLKKCYPLLGDQNVTGWVNIKKNLR